MSLDFEYGVNTGNRFLQFVDHDEEPEDFIAAQVKEEKQSKPTLTKNVKQTTSTTAKKTTTKTTTTSTSAKTNKENLTTKTTNADQRRPQSGNVSAVFSDNNQQTRGARGGARRGGATFDGAGRGARSQRFNKFEGKGPSNETSSFEQGGEGWTTGSTRGRGGQRQGNFEGGRGLGNRGRGRGGRGNFSNRADDDAQQNDNNNWQQSSDSQFDQDVSPIEPDNTRRNNRGSNRPRPNRNYDQDGEGQDYRANRRQFDRQPRSFTSSVKAIEKKDGEGAHNWGNPTENPEEHPVSDEITETTAQSTANKDWATQVDEAEKQMTLDEYKKQVEEKKRAHQEKVPQFKRREAGEGEDPKQWHKFEQEYRKKNGDDDEEDDEEEEEEEEAEEEYEEEQSGKKKIITIPLRFKPIDMQRGSGGSRGGPRRGGNRYRSNRDDQQQPTSPNQGQQQQQQQQQSSSSSSQQYDDQQRSYRGGRNSGDQRRPNRGGYRQGRGDPNAPALDNPEDFPTLPKQ